MGLAMVLHGAPGTGKSTLASTAPGPRLHLDTEGGGEWLAGKVIVWDNFGQLPEGIDENTTVTVNISGDNAMASFQSVYQWLLSGRHPFNSVIMDSLSEMQKRVIDKLTPIGGGDPDWTTLIRIMEKMVRDLKDLKVHATRPVQAVIFITGTQQKTSDKVTGPKHPMLTGKLAETLPHFVDVCGYTTLTFDGETNQMTQHLQILPFNDVVAKDRTSPPGKQGLSAVFGHTIVNPHIMTMLQVVNQAQAVA